MISSLSIVVNEICNLKCTYCYYVQNNKKYQFTTICLRDRDIRLFLDSINFTLDSITLTGGEPFLHIEIMEIIKTCKSKCKDLFILTNGTCLTDEMIDFLVYYNVKINISIDTISTDKKLNQRGNGVDVQTNIAKIITKSNSLVTLCPTNYYNNSNLILEMIDFYKKNLNFDRFLLGFVDLNNESPLSLSNINNIKKYIEGFDGRFTREFDNHLLHSIIFSLQKGTGSYIKECINTEKSIVINSNGNITPCFHRKDNLGNIKNSFEEIKEMHHNFINNAYYDCLSLACIRIPIR